MTRVKFAGEVRVAKEPLYRGQHKHPVFASAKHAGKPESMSDIISRLEKNPAYILSCTNKNPSETSELINAIDSRIKTLQGIGHTLSDEKQLDQILQLNPSQVAIKNLQQACKTLRAELTSAPPLRVSAPGYL